MYCKGKALVTKGIAEGPAERVVESTNVLEVVLAHH